MREKTTLNMHYFTVTQKITTPKWSLICYFLYRDWNWRHVRHRAVLLQFESRGPEEGHGRADGTHHEARRRRHHCHLAHRRLRLRHRRRHGKISKMLFKKQCGVELDNEIPVSKQPRSESISRLRRVQIFEKKILSPLFHALNGPWLLFHLR